MFFHFDEKMTDYILFQFLILGNKYLFLFFFRSSNLY
nr:MAG TPA: hypothetical protein [Caudoviricetes sp.]